MNDFNLIHFAIFLSNSETLERLECRSKGMKTKLVAFGLAIGICLWWLGTGLRSIRNAAHKETHQTYPLDTNGRVRLDNVNGKVRITAWDRAEIEVDAIIRAHRQADLDQVKIEIDSKPDQIQIHTQYPRRKWSLWRSGRSAIVNYDIKVPAQVRLEDVQNVNGNIEIEGVRGKVHASTVNGKLVVKGLFADSDLGSINGTVEGSLRQSGRC